MKTSSTQNSGRTANLRPFKKRPVWQPRRQTQDGKARGVDTGISRRKDRRQILEWLQKHKPEVLLHYAYGKPMDGADMEVKEKTTIAGLPEEHLERMRAYARQL